MNTRKAGEKDLFKLAEFLRGLDEYNYKVLGLSLMFSMYKLDFNDKQSYESIMGNYMKDEDNLFYLIENEGNPIGFAIVIMEPNKFGNNKLYATLDTIFIDEDFRRRGAGKMILDFIITELKNMNAVGLTSYIATNNAISVGFHEKNGFKEVTQWRELYKDL
ncbi:MAG: GNAT family N-acetyltransferase [Candidatus Dojkabacteria bacterium]